MTWVLEKQYRQLVSLQRSCRRREREIRMYRSWENVDVVRIIPSAYSSWCPVRCWTIGTINRIHTYTHTQTSHTRKVRGAGTLGLLFDHQGHWLCCKETGANRWVLYKGKVWDSSHYVRYVLVICVLLTYRITHLSYHSRIAPLTHHNRYNQYQIQTRTSQIRPTSYSNQRPVESNQVHMCFLWWSSQAS